MELSTSAMKPVPASNPGPRGNVRRRGADVDLNDSWFDRPAKLALVRLLRRLERAAAVQIDPIADAWFR